MEVSGLSPEAQQPKSSKKINKQKQENEPELTKSHINLITWTFFSSFMRKLALDKNIEFIFAEQQGVLDSASISKNFPNNLPVPQTLAKPRTFPKAGFI